MNSNIMDIRYLYGYKFVCQDKHYPKEACDVRSYYSTILSLSSNKNCKTSCSSRYQRNTNKCRAEQAISSYLSLLRQKGHSSSQLGSTHDTGSEFGYHTSMDYMSLPKVVLYQLPSYQGTLYIKTSKGYTSESTYGIAEKNDLSHGQKITS